MFVAEYTEDVEHAQTGVIGTFALGAHHMEVVIERRFELVGGCESLGQIDSGSIGCGILGQGCLQGRRCRRRVTLPYEPPTGVAPLRPWEPACRG